MSFATKSAAKLLRSVEIEREKTDFIEKYCLSMKKM